MPRSTRKPRSITRTYAMNRTELLEYLEKLLECSRFNDYCPNGLQVEGVAEIRHLVSGVTASQLLIDRAIELGADTVLVHHGWFWRGEDPRVLGIRRQRMAKLLANNINLIAYHLPLDAHPELGNNAQLARVMGWSLKGRCSTQDLVMLGSPDQTCRAGDVASAIEQRLGRQALLVGNADRVINTIAWCTGGAQGYFDHAIASGADLFVSGEISEQTVHLARESGVPYIAAGHHATERYGVLALGAHLASRFGLEFEHVDIDNPV